VPLKAIIVYTNIFTRFSQVEKVYFQSTLKKKKKWKLRVTNLQEASLHAISIL